MPGKHALPECAAHRERGDLRPPPGQRGLCEHAVQTVGDRTLWEGQARLGGSPALCPAPFPANHPAAWRPEQEAERRRGRYGHSKSPLEPSCHVLPGWAPDGLEVLGGSPATL